MGNELKMSVKSDDISIEIAHPYTDVTIDEMINDFVTCMIGLTFFKEQIIRGFKEYIENNTDESD